MYKHTHNGYIHSYTHTRMYTYNTRFVHQHACVKKFISNRVDPIVRMCVFINVYIYVYACVFISEMNDVTVTGLFEPERSNVRGHPLLSTWKHLRTCVYVYVYTHIYVYIDTSWENVCMATYTTYYCSWSCVCVCMYACMIAHLPGSLCRDSRLLRRAAKHSSISKHVLHAFTLACMHVFMCVCMKNTKVKYQQTCSVCSFTVISCMHACMYVCRTWHICKLPSTCERTSTA
jgi:hypothetical protein